MALTGTPGRRRGRGRRRDASAERHAQLLRVVVHLIIFFRHVEAAPSALLRARPLASEADDLVKAYVDLLMRCEQVLLFSLHRTCLSKGVGGRC